MSMNEETTLRARLDLDIANADRQLQEFGQRFGITFRSLKDPIEKGVNEGLERAQGKMRDTGRTAQEHIQGKMGGAFERASSTVAEFFGRFAGMAAVEEAIRRGTLEFANFERGMTRIQNETGATHTQLKTLEGVLEGLAKQTGASVDTLQQQFRDFQQRSQLAIEPATKLFTQMGTTAFAAGQDINAMSRLAIVALNNLRVPIDKVPEALAKWATVIPPSMMEPFAQVAPRITSTLANIGFVGEKAGTDIAAVFTGVQNSLGNTRRAASAVEQIFNQLGDIKTPLGAIMLGDRKEIMATGGSLIDLLDKTLERVTKMGLYSEDPAKRSMIQNMLHINPNEATVLRDLGNNWDRVHGAITASAGATDKLRENTKNLDRDSRSTIDHLIAGYHEVEKAIGEAFATTGALKGFEALIKGVVTDVHALVRAVESIKALNDALNKTPLEVLREGAGTVEPSGPAGTPTSPKEAPGGIVDYLFRGKKAPWSSRGITPETPEHRALGGPVSGGDPYLVGESGPEMFTPGSSGSVTSSADLQAQQERADAQMRDYFAKFRGRRNRAFTPGAGEEAQSADAMVQAWDGARGGVGSGGAGGGGGGTGPGAYAGGGAGPGGRTGSPWYGGRAGRGTGSGGAGSDGGEAALRVPTSPGEAPETMEAAVKGGFLPGGGGSDQKLTAGAGGVVNKAALQSRLENMISSSPLNNFKPADGDRYGIKTGSAKEWAAFMTKTAGAESSFKTSTVGDVGQFGGHGSRGLFQLSPQDALTYKIQNTPFTHEQLADPEVNARAAVSIMNQRVRAGGIGGREGAAKYWAHGSTLKPITAADIQQGGGSGAPGSISMGQMRTALGGGEGGAASTAAGAGGVTHSGTGKMVPNATREQMEYAGLMSGVTTDIAHGIEPGHARHTEGAPAGDVDLYDAVTKRKLDATKPDDRVKMEKYIEHAAAAGATGIGFGGEGGGYMGSSRMHIGGGKEAVWGAGGRGGNEPKWVRDAFARGRARAMTPQQRTAAIEKARGAQTASAGKISSAEKVSSAAGGATVSGKRDEDLDTASGKFKGKRDEDLDTASGKFGGRKRDEDLDVAAGKHIRAELEKPIRPTIEVPHMAPIRRQVQRHVTRMKQQDETRSARAEAHADIGFA
jgi:hypothetical protein